MAWRRRGQDLVGIGGVAGEMQPGICVQGEWGHHVRTTERTHFRLRQARTLTTTPYQSADPGIPALFTPSA